MSVLQRLWVYGGDYLMVAAIDIGTTYSGYAFSTRDTFPMEPWKILGNTWKTRQFESQKTSTCILFDKHKNFHSFGFDAEDNYSNFALDNEHTDYYFFRRFKTMLFHRLKSEPKIMLEDEIGKKMHALDVFSACIKYLRDHLLDKVRQQIPDLCDADIRWVLTVPATCDDVSKQFMRQAAEMAGIRGEHLLIALEPEAASLYCRHLPLEKLTGSVDGFAHQSKYLVLDAGGDIVDITAFEVKENGSLRELYKASCGNKGGTYTNKAFRDLLADIVGSDVMDNFQANKMVDYIDLFREFERRKRHINNEMTEKLCLRLPFALSEDFEEREHKKIKDHLKTKPDYKNTIRWIGDKFRMEADVAKGLFKESCDSIAKHLKSLFSQPELQDVPTILMVGGFSESSMLQDMIKKTMPGKTLIIPADAGLAVLKGAVVFGHDPSALREHNFRDGNDGCESGRNMHDKVGLGIKILRDGDDGCVSGRKMHGKDGLGIKQSRDTENDPTQPIQFDISSHAEPSDLMTQTKLVEKYSQLYEEAWIKAFEELQGSGENEKQCVTILREILTESYHCCCKMSENQRTTVAMAMTDASFVKSLGKTAASEMPKKKNFDVTQLVAISNNRRETFDVFVASLQLLLKTDPEYENWFFGKSLSKYSEECIELCWMMQIHSPPVKIDLEPRNGQEFDTNMLNPYTRSKRKVDFIVWPPLLSENGTVLCKGVAQGL